MTSLSRFLRPLILLASAAALASCGGLESLLNGTTGFQGTWSGSATANGTTGSMSLAIDVNGNVTGTDSISKPGFTATDTGTISTSGSLSLTTQYLGATVSTISVTVVAVSGTMSGSGTMLINGVGSTIQLQLTQNSTALRVK